MTLLWQYCWAFAVTAIILTDWSFCSLFSLSVCLTGILFSTLVFGPACGFILGSVCTKVYVDAVFIDTSELAGAFFFAFRQISKYSSTLMRYLSGLQTNLLQWLHWCAYFLKCFHLNHSSIRKCSNLNCFLKKDKLI